MYNFVITGRYLPLTHLGTAKACWDPFASFLKNIHTIRIKINKWISLFVFKTFYMPTYLSDISNIIFSVNKKKPDWSKYE